MTDIISRLKLESGEFDSRIKRAGQELLAYSAHCRKMGLEMGYANKDAKEFAKSLGSMQTTATTARGKASELSDAFVNLKAMYNQMTDAEKQGQFGKNLAASLDQLKQRTQEAKQELSDITKELNGASNIGGGGGLFSGDKLSGMLQVFGGNLMTKGVELATSAVTGLINETGEMIRQGVELAKQGEGIRIAFQRLGRGDILDGLREATHGTVTDIELMKAAVKFNDFKLPLDELGTMLAFAQQKAKDTGQSVDYMVDSIVTGLGRKSLMILDNLGLSATEIRERMKETGDMTKAVGAIIRDQMQQAGDYVETAADRALQANVSLQNKMEELGRKFAPLEEASNQLWTSMKIGILDIIGGPITTMLNELTEAGRIMNQLKNMNGGGEGKESRTDKALRMLREYSGGGRGIEGKRDLYNRQVESFSQQEQKAWREVERLRNDLNRMQRQQKEDPTRSSDLLPFINDTTRKMQAAQARAKAYQVARSQYEQGGKQYLDSLTVDVNVDTTKAIKGVSDLKKQLKELEAQRNKAVLAGDDEQVELLTKQINTTKQKIGYLDPNALKTDTTKVKTEEQRNNESIKKLTDEYLKATDERRAAIRAEIKDLQDKNKEIKRLTDEAQGIKIGDSSLPALTRQLQEYQQEQSEAANGKEWDEYQKKINATNDKINVLKGNLPKDKQATFTMNVNAEQLEQLRAKIPANSTIKVNVEQGNVDLPSVPTDDKTIKVNVEQGNVDLPSVPTDDKTIKVNITADTAEAMKQVRDLTANIEGTTVSIKTKVDYVQGSSGFNEKTIAEWTSLMKSQLSKEDFGTPVYNSIVESMKDMSTISDLTKEAIKLDIDPSSIGLTESFEKAFDNIDVSNGALQEIVDKINEELKEIGKDPIKIDFDTGSVKKQSKDMSMNWKDAASAIQSVGSAMTSIEDPAAKVIGTIAQAVATVALGYATATTQAASMGPWAWIAFAATGLATMISTITAIHSATGYANGGMIKGNSYSGDNLMVQGPSGELIGLNAGEIVLNRAQTANVASALQGNGIQGLNLTATIRGEQIRLALNNNGRRTGKGEYVQTNRR